MTPARRTDMPARTCLAGRLALVVVISLTIPTSRPARANCPFADLLVYDDGFMPPTFYVAANQLALSLVRVPSYEALNTELGASVYRAVAVSDRSWENEAGWGPLLDCVASGGHVVLGYMYLNYEPDLAAAFGVAAAGDSPQGSGATGLPCTTRSSAADLPGT
jgi:hypothetical protein